MMHPLFCDRVQVAEDTGCWEWLRSKDKGGYGRLTYRNVATGAHRVSYELHTGPIEDGLTVDHLCFNTGCVNPAHLQLLSRVSNAERQRSALSPQCAAGHLFDANNTYMRPSRGPEKRRNGRRNCRQCNADAARRYAQRKRNEELSA